MGITYPSLIREDVGPLHAAEKAARDKARADRVRLLRFLARASERDGVLS
jgi:hypothetical protein